MVGRPHGMQALLRISFLVTISMGLVLLVPSAARAQAASGAPGYSVRRAKVGRTWCTLAVPDRWQRKLLIYAHGYRPDDAPLAAPLHAEASAYQALLQNGWMVAATSYRRNGEIGAEAIEDIDALRSHVVDTYGSPTVTLLLGAAMGGTIVTRMAERRSSDYQGALAVSALAGLDESQARALGLTFEPRIPVLFLATAGGSSGPMDYAKRAAGAPLTPVVWTVKRSGELNVNQQELLAALNGLISWASGGRLEPSKDITYTAPRIAATTLNGKVLAVNRRFGNLTTSFTTADLDSLGIRIGDTFNLLVGGKAFPVRYVTGFGEAGRDEWLALASRSGLGESAFEDALTVARNGGNAAETAGADVGTPLTVEQPRTPPLSR